MKSETARDHDELIAYWSMAGTPHGRAWINVRRASKLLVWRSVIGGSIALKRALDIAVALATLAVWSRPPVPREVALYTPEDRQRLLARPGLTCVWQVSGRSKIDFNGQVRLDLQYIRSQSFLLDLKLLLKTIPAVLFGDGAY